MAEKPFWETKSLQQMSAAEWESLCDGCGYCCLVTLQDADTDEHHLTNMACTLLDIERCRCSDYSNRQFRIPECLKVEADAIESYEWLPDTCAYRRLYFSQTLPAWHPLITGDVETVHTAGASVKKFAQSEDDVHPDDWEAHIIPRNKS